MTVAVILLSTIAIFASILLAVAIADGIAKLVWKLKYSK